MAEFWIKMGLTVLIGTVLNIWLIWWVAFLIALVVVWGGFLIITGDVFD